MRLDELERGDLIELHFGDSGQAGLYLVSGVCVHAPQSIAVTRMDDNGIRWDPRFWRGLNWIPWGEFCWSYRPTFPPIATIEKFVQNDHEKLVRIVDSGKVGDLGRRRLRDDRVTLSVSGSEARQDER